MIYKFVIISGEEESFIREFELDGNNSLLEFHEALQEELEYDNAHLATFFTTTDNWEKEEEFTLFDMGANTTLMEDGVIDDVLVNDNQKLIYIFDLFNERALFIECVGETKLIVGREYPLCVHSHGLPPKQLIITGLSESEILLNDMANEELASDNDPDMPEFEDIDSLDDL